jgi:hypothetical protein
MISPPVSRVRQSFLEEPELLERGLVNIVDVVRQMQDVASPEAMRYTLAWYHG